MSFIGALNFYTKLIDKLHPNFKPFYDLLHEHTPWSWSRTTEDETLFYKLQKRSHFLYRTYNTQYRTSILNHS